VVHGFEPLRLYTITAKTAVLCPLIPLSQGRRGAEVPLPWERDIGRGHFRIFPIKLRLILTDGED